MSFNRKTCQNYFPTYGILISCNKFPVVGLVSTQRCQLRGSENKRLEATPPQKKTGEIKGMDPLQVQNGRGDKCQRGGLFSKFPPGPRPGTLGEKKVAGPTTFPKLPGWSLVFLLFPLQVCFSSACAHKKIKGIVSLLALALPRLSTWIIRCADSTLSDWSEKVSRFRACSL